MRSILFGPLVVCASVNAMPISLTVNRTVDAVTASIAGARVIAGDALTLMYTFESSTT